MMVPGCPAPYGPCTCETTQPLSAVETVVEEAFRRANEIEVEQLLEWLSQGDKETVWMKT